MGEPVAEIDLEEETVAAKRARRIGSGLVVALALAVPGASHAGPNLLPNASFELSALEPTPVPPYTHPQPLLPTGWAFEGAALLFDHYPAGSGFRTAHSGQRAIAISAPMSTKEELCADPPVGCHDNPINPARDAARPVYSITPHWRTALPVPVTGGTTYELSVWTQHEIVTLGEGATTRVRWLDVNRVPISEWQGPRRLAGPANPDNFWAEISDTVRAPNSARFAHVLLGHTDDSWIGQVRFDDVFFGTV